MRLFVALCLISVVHAGFFDSITNLFGGGSKKRNEPKLAPVSDTKARSYLQSFGYVPPSGLSSSPGGLSGDLSGAFNDAKSALKSAVRKFQEFAGLRVTGELDDATKTKMAAPRCGDPDVMAITSGSSAFKWSKNELTYSIDSYSSDLPRDDVKRAMSEAYSTWAAVTPLSFREVSPGQGDIKIKFGTGNHGDPWPFDGRSGVLAHATMPENGALHFDDDENWTYMDARKIDSNQATDLLAVAIHEAGHTLGLSHSRDESSIMAPFYQKTTDDNGNYIKPTLKRADIQDIQDIYGSGRGSVRPDVGPAPGRGGNPHAGGNVDIPSDRDRWTTSPPRTKTPWKPSGGGSSSGGRGRGGPCPVTVDGFAAMGDGTGYIFTSSKVYKINTESKKVIEDYSFSQMFPGGPSYVQAAVYNPINSILLVFSGGRVWGYTYSRLRGKFQLDSQYPKKLPSDINWVPTGAFRWINGHQVILGPSNQFAVYDEYWNQITMQNTVSRYFPNMPSGVKGIMPASGDYVIGFTLTRAFEYNTRTRTTNPSLRLMPSFLGCEESSFFSFLQSSGTSTAAFLALLVPFLVQIGLG